MDPFQPAPPVAASLEALLGRRSIAPRRLAGPAPAPEHIDLMLQAALAAPDHGRLHPWRVIEFRADTREQWLAAGAALGNVMNAAHTLGYGAIVLSGDRCFDPQIMEALGLGPGEYLAGFVGIGTIAEPPPDAARPISQAVWSCWSPGLQAQRLPARPTPAPFGFDDKDIA